MNNLAPIGLSTYVRLEHLQKTIAALAANSLAKYSDLYVFSDGASPGDEEKVEAVRRFLDTVDGFNTVHILRRESNGRIANGRGGLEQILEQYGKAIFIEEDVVTAPGFLQFINAGLEHYRDDDEVFSICGHTPVLPSLQHYGADYYPSGKFHSWGFGISKQAYDQIEYISPGHITAMKRQLKPKFDRYGSGLWELIVRDAQGKIDALDMKICYLQITQGRYSVLPAKPLVRNIGLDGTGAHCANDDPYAQDRLSAQMDFEFGPVEDPSDAVLAEYREFYRKMNVAERVRNRLRKVIS